MIKTYEVEFASKTYREYTVEAKNKQEAEEMASNALDGDDEASAAWKENAEVSNIKYVICTNRINKL